MTRRWNSQIFEKYVDTTFGEAVQSEGKIHQFSYNYRRYFPNDKDAPMLDVGIGRGEMLTLWEKMGYSDTWGIDISEQLVEFCESICSAKIELVNDTPDWLRTHKASFRLIALCDVLEHVRKEEAIDFLAGCREALEEEGALVVQMPNADSIWPGIHRYNDITHEFIVNPHALAQLLIASGFKNIEMHPFEPLVGRRGRMPLSLKRKLRDMLYRVVRWLRILDGSGVSDILTPVFFAVAYA